MGKVIWTVSACEDLEMLRPSPHEEEQIKATLQEVLDTKKTGFPVPFGQYPGCLVIDSGRFALLYRYESDNIIVLSVPPRGA